LAFIFENNLFHPSSQNRGLESFLNSQHTDVWNRKTRVLNSSLCRIL